jgi:hypothetical protein
MMLDIESRMSLEESSFLSVGSWPRWPAPCIPSRITFAFVRCIQNRPLLLVVVDRMRFSVWQKSIRLCTKLFYIDPHKSFGL